MPKIRCHYLDCLFLDEKYCTAAAIELNPDTGCLTYSPNEETAIDDWDDELDDWDDIDADEETDEAWIDEEEDDLDDEGDDY